MFHLGGPIYHYLNHCLLILQECTPAIIQKVRNLLADDLSSCIQTLQEAGEFCYQSRTLFKNELESTQVESNLKISWVTWITIFSSKGKLSRNVYHENKVLIILWNAQKGKLIHDIGHQLKIWKSDCFYNLLFEILAWLG